MMNNMKNDILNDTSIFSILLNHLQTVIIKYFIYFLHFNRVQHITNTINTQSTQISQDNPKFSASG